MTRQTEDKPATVPLAQQAGAIPAEWLWVKPCAWTIRMLTALITGVKGQKWFRLIDKVFAERNLWAAYQQVAEKKGAAGVDRVTVDQFGKQLPDSVWELSDQLRAGAYRPTGRATCLHSQTGINGKATAGDSCGTRPCGSGGGCERDRTDLRKGLCPAQLWIPSRTRMQRCSAACRRVAQTGTRLHRRRRSEELLRHHSPRSPDVTTGREDRRRGTPEVDPLFSGSEHSGRNEGMDPGSRRSSRGRAISAVE